MNKIYMDQGMLRAPVLPPLISKLLRDGISGKKSSKYSRTPQSDRRRRLGMGERKKDSSRVIGSCSHALRVHLSSPSSSSKSIERLSQRERSWDMSAMRL